MNGHQQGPKQGIKFEEYARAIGQGDIATRNDMAQMMGVCYSTAAYHLDRAVSAGLLNRQWGYVNDFQPGWLYARPATMPRLEGV